MSQRILQEYEMEFERAKSWEPNAGDWLASNWQGYAISSLCNSRPYNLTGVPLKTLHAIGDAITRIPDTFAAHAQVEELFKRRRDNLSRGKVHSTIAQL